MLAWPNEFFRMNRIFTVITQSPIIEIAGLQLGPWWLIQFCFPHVKQDVHHGQIISVPTGNLFMLLFDLEHKQCFLPVEMLPKNYKYYNNKNQISTQVTESPPCACFSVGLNPAFKIHSHSVCLRQTLQCVIALHSDPNRTTVRVLWGGRIAATNEKI